MLTPAAHAVTFAVKLALPSALENGNPPAAQRAALICSQIESVP
jgi:hypothetical protein